MKKGYIYILSNEIFHTNLLKIGMTKSDANTRSLQLSSSTSIPEEFTIEGSYDFYDITNVEKEIHKELSEFRYKKNKEFFTCDLNFAKQVILNFQIKDHKKYISDLIEKNILLINEINSIDNIVEKWKNFFLNLDWTFKIDYRDNSTFNIELAIKSFYLFENEENEITNSKALIKISNAKNFESIGSRIIQQIESFKIDNVRLFVLLNKPIIGFSEVFLGYEFRHNTWEKIRIINYDNKYGLFDENITYFDYINGRFPQRKDLLFADEKILTKW
ncbi:GIY-YIG nuclease family protein [Flavobacterium sp. xlx-214]|uniref:GIY-YIG nuclease family protein n=1 Tax=unclassified Flavobacterium TaxID=196869 RepID=UPI0013D3EF96|nr:MULTISPECIES: GIY-YIG nuclease family protein [unclassified Flavobacterium]MBA5791759.1 GIY-YIG nuclease family protein [Flavobacterium sp. xlx-221]QMI82998.1 GIY-YIG nuclease family protein [Flavobacterium sp. xlx-214]